jgi:hypothetical protein
MKKKDKKRQHIKKNNNKNKNNFLLNGFFNALKKTSVPCSNGRHKFIG